MYVCRENVEHYFAEPNFSKSFYTMVFFARLNRKVAFYCCKISFSAVQNVWVMTPP